MTSDTPSPLSRADARPISRHLLSFSLIALAGLGSLRAADQNDEETIRKNAAEQAGALHQDPGGNDRDALLAARAKNKITAGLPGERTDHPDAQWFGKVSHGLFLHWGISSAHGDIDLSWPMIFNMGKGTKLKPAEYWNLAGKFKAENYDPGKWLKAAREAGFGYAVMVTKHHDGYTLFPTEASEIGVRTSLPGRDLVKEYVEACRANGLKVGFYFSGPDWYKVRNHMSFNYRSEKGDNSTLPPIPGRPDFDTNWQPTKVSPVPAELKKQMMRENRQELTELLTRYGKIDLLWFDGSTGSDMTVEEIRKLQPGIVINNRSGAPISATPGSPKFKGDYFTVEGGDQPFRPPGWWEQLRIWNSPCWGYMTKNEQSYVSSASILKSIARSRAWGGSVLANCGPRPDGTMPDPYYKGMAEVRDWMKLNGESVIGADPVPEAAEANVPVTTRGNIWYLHAVAGTKEAIIVKPGIPVQSILSAKNLRTGESVPFDWKEGVLTVNIPAPASGKAHDVIAVTLNPGK